MDFGLERGRLLPYGRGQVEGQTRQMASAGEGSLSVRPGRGSVGALLGMGFFRHKTRHWTFRLGMPAILILQVAALTAWTYWDVFLR